ncbi:hypothetical protein [Flavobacterium sp.]|uniref:hypothetical protein n=1 Tax=Flavobacterium sp. TaxID=239 RepID=UPI0026034254|nr:hypothetical protein [Flavobacterium sp.]
MNYLNITKYIYLAIGFIMVYDTISKWNNDPKPYLSIMLAAMAFFLFFFRSKFGKKFEERKKQQNQTKS